MKLRITGIGFRGVILSFLTIIVCLVFLPTAFADSFYSPNYKIDPPNINIGTDNYTSSSPTSGTKISSILGKTAAEQFKSAGYIVKEGFQIPIPAPFTFAISDTNIDFATLTPGTPSTASANFTVSFSSATGYQVTASEGDSLKTLTGASIPDTSCDTATPCTISSANTWSSSSTYGFGYNMSSGSYPDDIPADFNAASKYRPFANLALAENPIVVMSINNSKTPTQLDQNSIRQTTMTFKVNVSAAQTAGSYTTVVRFTATPLY